MDVRKTLSVVIPLHNEQENLRELHRRLCAAAQDAAGEFDMEFIFVDDGSTDQSASILTELSRSDRRVTLIQLTRCWGSHAAVKTGLLHGRGERFAAISADLQDPPEMLPEFYREADKGFDVVWGMRAERDDPWLKTQFANAFYSVFRRLLPNLPKGGVDTFLISRTVRDQVLAMPEKHNPPYYQILWLGYKYAVVPYKRAARTAGVSKWSFRRRLKMAFDSIISFSRGPLQALWTVGAVLAGSGLLAMMALTLSFLGLIPGFFSATGALVCMVGGLNLMGMGLLGEYMWRIAEDGRRRPDACIEKVVRPAVLERHAA